MHHSTLSSTHGLHARDARGGPPLSRDEWKVSKTFPNVPKGAEPFPVGNHWPNYFWSPPLESQRAGMESATWPTSVSQDLRQGGSRQTTAGGVRDQDGLAAEGKVCAVPRGQPLPGRTKTENVAENPPSGAGGEPERRQGQRGGRRAGTAASERLREERDQEVQTTVPRAGELEGPPESRPTRVESESQTVGEERREVIRMRLS